MINLLKKIKRVLIEALGQYRQLRVNAENEYQAMSCGAFNPHFLAKIRRCKAGSSKHMHTEK
jgi:hypothetical protein